MTRDDIVAETRSWIGTPYHHQAALKGVGCDCIGLLRGVYEAFVAPLKVEINYSPHWHFHRAEEVLYAHACQYADEIPLESAHIGDVLLFGFGTGPAAHAGIITTADTIIHAYAEIGKVAETRLSEKWLARRRFAFRFPGLAE
jgi:NlpC/P60 family putative phage cell wall peptidase